MESPFSGSINHSERNHLAPSQIMIHQQPQQQQYASYPAVALEPTLQSASSPGSARNRVAASNSPPLNRKETPRSLQSSPTSLRSAPAFDPHHQRRTGDPVDQAESRTLPSHELTDETIDDAYIAFIFYCNPNVPLSANTYELRRTFRCPPRSDGKNFSIFTLWELIRKLDNKELKTWIQLSIELGVEPPSLEKKQSTQKVQQYAVRLKRWMRAMHVDAFFEYCLGHPHPYYTQLPPPYASVCDSRDGVPLEEDLALRALVPEWKPKRGRKRVEERDFVEEGPTKRPQLDTSEGTLHTVGCTTHSASFPQSAIPFSAFPDDMESTDPWVAAASSFGADGDPATQQGQELRWRPLERDASPAGYPQSAILPGAHRPLDPYPTEPRSAITPSSGEKPRSRRRHGPAVSSAWLGNSGSANGKTRGRPPNKTTVSGPFSSFPVNPNRTHPSNNQSPDTKPPQIVFENDSPYQQSPNPFVPINVRPSKLQLQVPQHSGGPVRLATPPTLLVNGVDDASRSLERKSTNGGNGPSNSSGSSLFHNDNKFSLSQTNLRADDVVRLLSAELLGGKLSGRSTALSSEEARALASSVVANLMDLYSKASLGSPILMAALHLGQGHHFGFTEVAPGSISVSVNASPTSIEGSGLLGMNSPPQSAVYTISYEYKHPSRISTRVTCNDIDIGHIGAVPPDNTAKPTNNNDIKSLDGATDAEFEFDCAESDVSDATWKQRYMKLRAQLQKKDRALSQYKRRILESVMTDI